VAGVVLVSVVSFAALLVYSRRPRKLLLEVWPDRLVVDEGRGGTFPLETARLGEWQLPTPGVAAGTALHLDAGGQRFCVGGRDHRLHPALHLDAPPTPTVDAHVTAAELESILGAMAGVVSGEVAAPPGDPHVAQCRLEPNRSSTWSLSPVAPAVVLELDAHSLRVVDVVTGALVAAAPMARVQGTPAKHEQAGGQRATMPMLVLVVPGAKAITVGIAEFHFSWLGEAPDYGAADYVVGGADWLTLVDRLGLRHLLKVGEG
jgi:hypothetical protein